MNALYAVSVTAPNQHLDFITTINITPKMVPKNSLTMKNKYRNVVVASSTSPGQPSICTSRKNTTEGTLKALLKNQTSGLKAGFPKTLYSNNP